MGFGTAAGADKTVTFGWPVKLNTALEVSQGGTGAKNASSACANIGAVKKSGDTMTGNLSIQSSLYPSLYLLPTYDNTKNRIVFEGSSADEPTISDLAMQCHVAVNIRYADTREVSGKLFGQMILQLPEDHLQQEKAIYFLQNKGLRVEEVNGHVHG